jgi:hypothetical protein
MSVKDTYKPVMHIQGYYSRGCTRIYVVLLIRLFTYVRSEYVPSPGKVLLTLLKPVQLLFL